MHRRLLIASTILALATVNASAESKRQMAAHQHGHGTLNLAVEGQTLQMELEVPGADIVGFEHATKSAGDQAKVKAAKKKLSEPLALFALPAAAGCKIASSSVMVEGEKETKGSDHDAHRHSHDEKHREEGDQESHSEFRAEYAFTCSNMNAITDVAFPYFEAFPNSEELAVTIITDKSQKTFEVTRNNPLIDLRGMM